jgi:alkanesulfonate monooxygenase SsuD/methylene tetrahydromethanopterin reductase-like flavin-dependent oxidoreductase (luciferase family)
VASGADDRPFRLGFLTHVHGAGRGADAVYRDLLEIFTAAEELGFDGGWVAQHHLRDDYGRLPSPLVLFGALTERTTRLRLGTAVTVLPLEDPLRLAEDASVLDILSGGRLELGLGTGGANLDAFAAFGHDPKDRHERFDTGLETLRSALRGEPLHGISPDGRAPLLQPRAASLAERLWQSPSTTERAESAGRRGDGLLLGTATHNPETIQRPLAEAYLTGLREGGPAGGEPRIGVVRAVFPAADRATARDDLAPALDIHRRHFIEHGRTELASLSVDEYLGRINVHHGHPDEIAASLRADPALLAYTRPPDAARPGWFLPVAGHELSSADAEIRRLEAIATGIAPSLGWHPVTSNLRSAA